MRADRPRVEADDARKPEVARRRGKQADATAEAEADRVEPLRAPAVDPTEVVDRGRHVRLDRLVPKLEDVGLVFEPLAALRGPRRPRVRVDRHGVDPRLRETQRELLVIRMQPADVGEHDHARPGGLLAADRVGREARAIGAGEREVTRVEGGAADRRQRRARVEVEAHQPMNRSMATYEPIASRTATPA